MFSLGCLITLKSNYNLKGEFNNVLTSSIAFVKLIHISEVTFLNIITAADTALLLSATT